MNLNLKNAGRAAVVALTLGATAFTAVPAQAQSGSPSFSFNFGINGGGDSFSFGINNGRQIRRACLTNNEIRRGLRARGWDDITFLDRRGNRVTVLADWGRRTYKMVINRCTGRVSDIDRVYRTPGRGPGFTLNFNFRDNDDRGRGGRGNDDGPRGGRGDGPGRGMDIR